jgi:IS5 family transposase
MAGKRFKALGMGSFFGRLVYERVVPRDHFLVKLNEVIEWDSFTAVLLPAYKGLAEEGRPPYPPVVILKMLVMAYLYRFSERQVEEATNFNLAIKEFVGLAVDELAPDHSTLSAFNKRLRESGGWAAFQAINDRVLRQAEAAGVKWGTIQIVDSVHTVADVDNEADRERQGKGQPPRDQQARVVNKGQRRQAGPDGKVTEQSVQYLGYKSHVSLNAASGLITTVEPSVGSAADNEQFAKLLQHDEQLGVSASIYSGDKAYDDSDLHVQLWASGKASALKLRLQRVEKKDAHKEPWQTMLATEEYQRGQAERYKIERKFGEAKRWHGFGRCRYLGLVRYGIQAHLTALVLNLKRIITLLTSVRFRPGSRKPQVAAT